MRKCLLCHGSIAQWLRPGYLQWRTARHTSDSALLALATIYGLFIAAVLVRLASDKDWSSKHLHDYCILHTTPYSLYLCGVSYRNNIQCSTRYDACMVQEFAVKTLSCFALNQGQRVDRRWARSHPLDSPALLDTIRRRCKRCHGLWWTHTWTDSVRAPYCIYRLLYLIRSPPASMSTVPR